MPADIRYYLAAKYHQDLVVLARRFGGHAARWCRAAEAALCTAIVGSEFCDLLNSIDWSF